MSKPVVVSFSGGRTSAYMAAMLIKRRPDLDLHFVFANTGLEREETLVFVNECDKYWGVNLTWIESVVNPEKGVGVSYRIVDFKSASRDGRPFFDMVAKFGIPNKEFPFCTRDLKDRPIKKWVEDTLGLEYEIAIGIRADERSRPTSKKNAIYPLVNWWPTWEVQVRNFWDGMPFDLQLKDYEGNCDLCWKKSRRKRLTLIKENPAIADRWAKMEADSDYVFDRGGISIIDLVKMSKRKFRPALDKHELSKSCNLLFNDEFESDDFDIESSCHCN